MIYVILLLALLDGTGDLSESPKEVMLGGAPADDPSNLIGLPGPRPGGLGA